MIALTGGTGKLGHHVIESLLKEVPANQIIAIVRNTEKAADLKALGLILRQADYNDPSALSKALEGVNKLLLISSSEVGQRARQHENVITAAKNNHVQRIVYTSLLRADSSSLALAEEHILTEKLLKSSGLSYTLLRNGWYLENHSENMASALQTGSWLECAGDGRFAAASRLDYAQAAVRTLLDAGHENKVYELAGDTSFTLSELAAELSQLSGKAVSYTDVPETQYQEMLISFGVPAGMAHVLANSDTGAKNGDLNSNSKDLSQLIGRKTETLSESIKKHL